jgi:YaiO family outer membrane protein
LLLSVLLLTASLPGLSESPAGRAAAQVPPQESLTRARAFEAERQYEQAIAHYRTYLTARPEDDEVRGALARLLSWQNAYEEAGALYEDILTRHPADVDVRVALARVRAWQRQFAEARRLYERVLDEDAANLEARRSFADMLYWSGEYATALRHYEIVFATTPDPEIAQRIEAVRTELAPPAPVVSLRALVGPRHSVLGFPYRDYVKIGYGRFTSTAALPHEQAGLLEVAKPLGQYTLVGRLEVLDRFGFNDVLLSGELYSPLWKHAWGYLSTSVGVDPDFAPQWTIGGEVFQSLSTVHQALGFLEPSLGYRHLRFRTADVDLLVPGLTVYLPYNIWLTEKVYYVLYPSSVTLLSQLTWRATERLQFFITGTYGDTAERVGALQDISRVTTHSVQVGVTFPIAARLSAEVSGYYEDRHGQGIRRGGTMNLLVHW